MKPKRFELTRDSRLLWLGVAGGAIAYLMAAPPPWTWSYYQWLQAAGAFIAATSTKYMTSGLRGKHDRAPRRRAGR